MRNLLAFFAAALLTFAGLGWYLDWYTISSSPEPDGHRQVNINLNTDKIEQDLEKGSQKVRNLLEKGKKEPDGKTEQPPGGSAAPPNQPKPPADKP
jgi:hypothetical protein